MPSIPIRNLMLAASAAVLAACGMTQFPAANHLSPQGGGAARAALSWMAPRLAKKSLLYISDPSSGNVYVYSYPRERLVGTLAVSPMLPQGLCADSVGDIFVTVQGGTILEYAHGGTQPLQTLHDHEYPIACSIDPTTGDLAAANESGNVSIFSKASGEPTTYTTPMVPLYAAYDASGNLFVDGSGAPGVRIAELPKGATSFAMVGYHGRNNGLPAGLQWVGNQLAVGSASPYQQFCCGRIFRLEVGSDGAKQVGKTHIPGAMANFFIEGTTAIVTTATRRVSFYQYPDGTLIKTMKEPSRSSFGVVISRAST